LEAQAASAQATTEPGRPIGVVVAIDESAKRIALKLDAGPWGRATTPQLHTGDTLAYVYTLTAEGTTHGFEQGYDAFLGDPFGVDVVADNLRVTVALADTPEPGMGALMMLGVSGLLVWRRRAHRAARAGVLE
jgi:hypothetical protein